MPLGSRSMHTATSIHVHQNQNRYKTGRYLKCKTIFCVQEIQQLEMVNLEATIVDHIERLRIFCELIIAYPGIVRRTHFASKMVHISSGKNLYSVCKGLFFFAKGYSLAFVVSCVTLSAWNACMMSVHVYEYITHPCPSVICHGMTPIYTLNSHSHMYTRISHRRTVLQSTASPHANGVWYLIQIILTF